MSEPKVQHYVPQLILRKFSAKKKKTWQINVFDKSTGRAYKSNVNRAAAESGFYEFKVDDWTVSAEPMFTAMESKFGPVLEKVLETRKLRALTDEEKARIAHYMAVQRQRGPGSRLDAAAFVGELVDVLRSRGCDDAYIEKTFGPTPSENDLRRESLQRIRDPEFISAIANGFLEGKIWVLLQNDTSAPFLLGDNPVVLQNVSDLNSSHGGTGITSPGIEIYFPLAPNLALAVICKSIFLEFLRTRDRSTAAHMYLSAVEQDVPVIFAEGQGSNFLRKLNFLQVGSAERFIFSKDGNFDMVRDVLDVCPELRSGQRPKRVRFDE